MMRTVHVCTATCMTLFAVQLLMAGDSVYLDPGTDQAIPEPTIVANWGIHDAEVGATYDGVSVEANIGYYLCTANFLPNYPITPGDYYLWSNSGNWDSIGLKVNHVKRVYDFITDPGTWTETGAGSKAQECGMDDLTVAGPTRMIPDIGIDEIPGVPDKIDVSIKSKLWFNVNIASGHDVVIDQYAQIEYLNVSHPGAELSVNAAGTLRCERGFENAGTFIGAIEHIGGVGLKNYGSMQGAFVLVEDGIYNCSDGHIFCEGGTLKGTITNDGLIETWNPTTIDTLSITGDGQLIAKDALTLSNTAEPTMGTILEQPLTSRVKLYAQHPLQTSGNGHVTAQGVFQGTLAGDMTVAEGELLTLQATSLTQHANLAINGTDTKLDWWNGTNEGMIHATAGGTLQTRGYYFEVTNAGQIVLGNASFSLPAPGLGTTQILTNTGSIDLDHSEMNFGCITFYIRGVKVVGDGQITLRNDSVLRDPYIQSTGTVDIDATSRVEVNSDQERHAILQGDVTNHGTISISRALTCSGSLTNHGLIEINSSRLILQTSALYGTGQLVVGSAGEIEFDAPAGHTDPIMLHHAIVSAGKIYANHPIATDDGVAITAHGWFHGALAGDLHVTPGEYLGLYGSTLTPNAAVTIDQAGTKLDWYTGTNEGLIQATNGGTMQTRGYYFEVTNAGRIEITDATFALPAPGLYTTQVLTNTGTIDLDHSQMTFGYDRGGPTIAGNGQILIRNGSTVYNPRITGGDMTVDATSQIVFTLTDASVAGLEQHGSLQLDGRYLAVYGRWQTMVGATVAASAGSWHDLYLYGDWVNQMDDPADLSLPRTFIEVRSGTEADPLLLEVGGIDRGAVPEGWEENYALLKLVVAAGHYVRLTDQFDNHAAMPRSGSEALYLDYLELKPGAILDTQGLNVYYKTLIGDPTQIIPEPATLVLLSGGVLGLLRRGGRR